MTDVIKIGENAKAAARKLAIASTQNKNEALTRIASELVRRGNEIIAANKKDLENGKDAGLTAALLDRLMLDEARIAAISEGLFEVIALDDPAGKTIEEFIRPNGLKIKKITVPIGVIAIIFEARPNVTADAAALCLKSGNAVILRGGKEAIYSNTAIARVMRDALASCGMDENCVQLIEDTTRESTEKLMKLNGYVDLLIPRGGAGLIKNVISNATVPVIETGAGTCHIYVDKSADLGAAAKIIFNAKTSRPSVCNACECVIIHKDVLQPALNRIIPLLKSKNVEMRGDENSVRAGNGHIIPASREDWGKEYDDYIVAVKTVDDLNGALEHIYKYGTKHSECIIAGDECAINRFHNEVDAAAVYSNASTRFTDGFEFGFGAEIGISTQMLHARGPMGLRELTSYKYVISGDGQIRE